MIRITAEIAIDEREIEERFSRASGPGGQNVNKVSSAVELRFDIAHSPSLPEDTRSRLIALAGRRVTQDGVLVIRAERFRAQKQNRDDAVQRLCDLVRKAAIAPKPRRKTRPSRAAKQRRLETKQRRSTVKRLRGQRAEVGE